MTDKKEVVPFYYSSNGNTEEDKILLEPIEYILQSNDIHPYREISSLFNYWFKVSPDKLQLIDEVMQMVCNASFM
ncbi:PREDICTED: geranylgeranyl pyrophosphate synthase-like [Atta cephalotes]|uniref:Uncharacterized protein n=1 Tax=Atta cephalotes TaxID=12957 RepID=A0A158NEW7_ATTCE|nr:PREDICTED: geranylgeranyl pyrophosphate synthase-like [Atta cephalotes]